MAYKILLVLSIITVTFAQRSPYAGRRPIGYPAIVNTLPSTTGDGLSNKFGSDDNGPTTTTTTQRLPIEALGDLDLVNRISKLPVDQQPFWYLNWKALEDQRKNPQNWPQRPNIFIDNNQANQIMF